MLNRRSFALAVFSLILLSVAGLAYLSPAFAASCKATYVKSTMWVRQQAHVAGSSFTRTAFYVSYKEALRESASRRERRGQTRADLSATKRSTTVSESSRAATQQPAQRSSLAAGQTIANGHAFAKHANEFGFVSAEQMGDHIDGIISRARPSNVRNLLRGRTAYWDENSGTVVIVDPNTADGGTAFKPDRGRSYFESLR